MQSIEDPIILIIQIQKTQKNNIMNLTCRQDLFIKIVADLIKLKIQKVTMMIVQRDMKEGICRADIIIIAHLKSKIKILVMIATHLVKKYDADDYYYVGIQCPCHRLH